MSNAPKETPYVYQPFGIQNKDHWNEGRLWAVAPSNRLTRIEGLTKEEADAVCDLLKKLSSRMQVTV